VNAALKYLTAETFGHKVNANGLTLKKKQLWTMEPFGDHTDAVCLKSHLDKYLSVDQVPPSRPSSLSTSSNWFPIDPSLVSSTPISLAIRTRWIY